MVCLLCIVVSSFRNKENEKVEGALQYCRLRVKESGELGVMLS